MKKKLFVLLTAAMMLMTVLPTAAVSAAENEKTYGPLTYVVYEDQIHIARCDPDAVEVCIPTEIAGKTVTVIRDGAFADCDRLTSLTFFSPLYYIGSYVFTDCDALTEVHYRGTKENRDGMMLWVNGNQPLFQATWVYELPGDVDDNGKVNNRDLGLLQKYLNDDDVTIDLTLADMNGDGKVNNRDLGKLQHRLNNEDEASEDSWFNDGTLCWNY